MLSQDNQPLNRNADGVMAATGAPPIATYGEVFVDGAIIELIRGAQDGSPELMLWDGTKETIGARVEHRGQLYKPAPITASILRELNLSTHRCTHGSTCEFLEATCKLVATYTGLPEKSTSLVGRFVLATALVEALSVAPTLTIVGPDTARGNRLMELLRCLCRHSLPLTGVTPAGFCSLASGARFTYLISQACVGDKLHTLLDDVTSRERKIPFRGRLLDLFGVQVIHSASHVAGDSRALRSIQIPMISTGHDLPVFDFDTRLRITNDFQAKSLSFRRASLGMACKMDFDASNFAFALRDRARSLATATPDDRELQAGVFNLLREEDAEIRADRLIDPSVIAGEAVLVGWHGSPAGTVYVADLAVFAQEILRRRGEATTIEPAVFGKQLKLLGFVTERDAKGKKLRLTEAVRDRAQELVRDIGAPEGSDGPRQSERES
jgi:hypothetical protein